MATIIFVTVFVVLLILACTFGLLRKTNKKDRHNPFYDVMTTIASVPPPGATGVDAAGNPMVMSPMGPGMPGPPGSGVHPSGSTPSGFIVPTSSAQGNPYNPYGMMPQTTTGYGQNTGMPTYQYSGYPAYQDPRTIKAGPQAGYGYPVPGPPDSRWIAPGTNAGSMGRGIMGSAEAEFHNDFIDVFEMRHLEPKPDFDQP